MASQCELFPPRAIAHRVCPRMSRAARGEQNEAHAARADEQRNTRRGTAPRERHARPGNRRCISWNTMSGRAAIASGMPDVAKPSAA